MQIDLKGFTELITAVRIGDDFNQTSEHAIITRSITDALVGHNVEVEIALLEDFLEKLDDLECKDVLAQVVIDLEYARYDSCWHSSDQR